MIFDRLIEERLGDGRIVHFAVAMATVADHVHHHVAAESVSVFQGYAADAHYRVHVFGIHVEDGNGLAAGDLSGEARGVFLVVQGGKAQQVIGDDVDGPANRITLEISEIDGLSYDALAGKCGVAVNQQWEIFLLATLAGAVLLGPGAANRDRIHCLQMTGIRSEMDVDFRARAGNVFAGRAHVIFHVPAAQDAARVNIFKTCEHFFRSPPGDVHNHVEPPAVAHAHHQLDGAPFSSRFDDFIHQRNQRSHTFQRETFVAQIALLQDLLKDIGANQLIEHVFLVHGRLRVLHAFLDPAAALRICDVGEFYPYRAAIDAAGFMRKFTPDLQIGMRLRPQEAEGIKIGLKISPAAEGVKNALALSVRLQQYRAGSFRLSSHRVSYRIKDAGQNAEDASQISCPQVYLGGIGPKVESVISAWAKTCKVIREHGH
jgi:hypothetical protein